VNPQVVRDLRATAAGLEEAARQYRELVDRSGRKLRILWKYYVAGLMQA
jgi:hypothetical protein